MLVIAESVEGIDTPLMLTRLQATARCGAMSVKRSRGLVDSWVTAMGILLITSAYLF